jgi:uncharacterized membrane protein
LKKLRNYFISGLLFWIPLGLSVVIFKFILDKLNNILPKQYLPEQLLFIDNKIPIFGAIIVVLIIFITGVLVSNIIGAKILNFWEKLLAKIPVFRIIYKSLKKVLDTVLNPSSESFKKALLVEYPRKGLWTIAFQTGSYKWNLEKIVGDDIINIYVPTTPNPTSGFFIMMAKKDVIELDMSVDQALKLIISAGVIDPEEK